MLQLFPLEGNANETTTDVVLDLADSLESIDSAKGAAQLIQSITSVLNSDVSTLACVNYLCNAQSIWSRTWCGVVAESGIYDMVEKVCQHSLNFPVLTI